MSQTERTLKIHKIIQLLHVSITTNRTISYICENLKLKAYEKISIYVDDVHLHDRMGTGRERI